MCLSPIGVYASHFLGQVLGCAYTICLYGRFEISCSFPSGSPSRPSRVSPYTPSVLICCIRLLLLLLLYSFSQHYKLMGFPGNRATASPLSSVGRLIGRGEVWFQAENFCTRAVLNLRNAENRLSIFLVFVLRLIWTAIAIQSNLRTRFEFMSRSSCDEWFAIKVDR